MEAVHWRTFELVGLMTRRWLFLAVLGGPWGGSFSKTQRLKESMFLLLLHNPVLASVEGRQGF